MTLEARRDVKIEDPGADLLNRVSGTWAHYGRYALVAAGVLVVGGAIAFLMMRARARSEEQAAGQLAQANMFYWQGEYARSLEVARQVSQQYPSTPSGVDARRLAGDNAYWTGDYKTAIAEYRDYLSRKKDGIVAEAVRRSLAYALESDQQFAEAATLYEGLIGKFDRESSAEFLAAASRCHRMLGQNDQAIERLQRLLKEFGASSNANVARIDLAELQAASR